MKIVIEADENENGIGTITIDDQEPRPMYLVGIDQSCEAYREYTLGSATSAFRRHPNTEMTLRILLPPLPSPPGMIPCEAPPDNDTDSDDWVYDYFDEELDEDCDGEEGDEDGMDY